MSSCVETKVRIYITISAVDVVGVPNFNVSARIVIKDHDGSKWGCPREVIIPTFVTNQITDGLPDTLAAQLDLLDRLSFRVGEVYIEGKNGQQSVVAVQAQNTNANQIIGDIGQFVGTQLGALITAASDTSITALVKVQHSVRFCHQPAWYVSLFDPCHSVSLADESEVIIKREDFQSSVRFQPGVEQLVASLTFEKTDDYSAAA